jgi:hypothetical protein
MVIASRPRRATSRLHPSQRSKQIALQTLSNASEVSGYHSGNLGF